MFTIQQFFLRNGKSMAALYAVALAHSSATSAQPLLVIGFRTSADQIVEVVVQAS